METKINGAILTIRRPDGTVEEVVNTKQSGFGGVIHARTFDAMVKATRDGGRGEILSQRPNVVPMTDAEIIAGQRDAIMCRIENGKGEFPGSRKWIDANAAERELAAFDAQHGTAPQPRQLTDAALRGLRGED